MTFGPKRSEALKCVASLRFGLQKFGDRNSRSNRLQILSERQSVIPAQAGIQQRSACPPARG
jgi:hypothetical protein